MPLLPPHKTPTTTEEGLNGLIPQRFFDGEDTWQMYRDKREAGIA